MPQIDLAGPRMHAGVHQLPRRSKTPSGYRMTNRGGTGEIYLYGVIGGDWYGEGVTAKQFAADLKALGSVSALDIRINSEGGSVTDAEAIYTHLVEHKARKTGHVDGLAASAASFIMMACDEILIAESGFIMIHEARMGCWGTSADLKRYADLLDRTNDRIVAKYAARTGNKEPQIRDWMAAETWWLGEEAVKNGFADKVVENLRVAAMVTHPERFAKLPGALQPNRTRALAALKGAGLTFAAT